MFAAISNVTANGIKFNGQNYDDWIEYTPSRESVQYMIL